MESPNVIEKNDVTLNNELSTNKNDERLSLEYGDIIEIHSPSNPTYHESLFFVSYRDENVVDINKISSGETSTLNILDDGSFSDESIEFIVLVSRSEEYGYARQNKLLPKTWIEIQIGGDVKQIITGEITDLEEDQIEITTYPELQVFYIDFEYKGIPRNIPIDEILIREKPEALQKIGTLTSLREKQEEDGTEGLTLDEIHEPATIEFNEQGESVITLPEGTVTDETFKEHLQELYIDANEIIFGEEVETIKHVIEIPENEMRYSIETQVNDMMDGLLATIPNHRRNINVMASVHRLISRFKELRDKYSLFDDDSDIQGKKKYGSNNKPLIERLKNMDMNLKWLIPVVSLRKYVTFDETKYEGTPDVINTPDNYLIDTAFSKIETFHKSKLPGVRGNYSDTYNSVFDDLSDTQPLNDPYNHLHNGEVNAYIEGIVSNLNKFYSGVFSQLQNEKKFFIQTYNLGLSKLEKTPGAVRKNDYQRTSMTPNNTIHINSFIMMPQQIAQKSSIHLPNKSILERFNLHKKPLYLFELLHRNRDILPNVIEDLTSEVGYGEDAKLLSKFQEFVIQLNEFQEEPDLYEKYLQAFIPKTQVILDSIRKYTTDKFSFINVVKQLEPYGIYNEHITFQQYKKIHYIIRTNIKSLKEHISKQSKLFFGLKENNVIPALRSNPFLQLFSNKPELLEEFFSSYKINEDIAMTTDELYTHLLKTDDQRLFNSFISAMLVSLVTPANLLDKLYPPDIENNEDGQPDIQMGDCGQKYIAKKYNSVDEMENDNGNEIFFDETYDITPYTLLETYKEQESSMSGDLFKEFLENVLVKKHYMTKDEASKTVTNLLVKKKLVEDGHYAILETNESTGEEGKENELQIKREYYIRKGSDWIRDTTINDTAFLDTASIFCNISKECFQNKKTDICEDPSISIMRHREESRKQLLDEFDRRIKISVDEMEADLQKTVNHLLKQIRSSRIIDEIKAYRANNLAFEIGKHVERLDTPSSPHEIILNKILGKSDFVQKQNHITIFVGKYCRPYIPKLEESPYWYYCKDTNIPLLPTSIYKLASAFLLGPENYQRTLEELRVSQGEESDDGNAIVDKYSGFILCKKDFNIDEGFDDSGFRIVTRDIIEEDAGQIYLKQKKQETLLRNNQESQLIDIVYFAIIERISIPPNTLHEFVLRISSELIQKEIYSEEKYQRLAAKKKKDEKKVEPYQTYKLQTSILIISSVLFVGIQTLIPSINVSKTFPNCVRSFSGYPMTNDDDLSGIQYIACILRKMKSSISPWSSIQQLSAKNLEARIQKVIAKTLVEHPEVVELYVKKNTYNQLHPDTTIPKEHSLQKWRLFQPALVPIKIENPTINVSETFQKELLQEMKKGRPQQYPMIAMLHSKNSLFSYRLLQSIHSIVRQEETLLHTSGMVPFQQNGCCHGDSILPLSFFKEKDVLLEQYIENVKKNQTFLKGFKKSSQASLLYHDTFSGMEHPKIISGNMEENVYSTIIKHCKYDTEQNVPEEFKAICSDKPTNYDSQMSLSEKITLLKRSGKQYNEKDMRNLMDIVHRNNMITMENTPPQDPVISLKEYIQELDTLDDECISPKLRELLLKIIDEYDPDTYKTEMSKHLENLQIHLYNCNNDLIDEITSFMESNNQPSMEELLSEIEQWNFYQENNLGFFNVCKNIKNKIYQITSLYPNLFQYTEQDGQQGLHSSFYNHNENDKNIWKVASRHFIDLRDLHDEYYDPITKFYYDPILSRVMTLSQEPLKCLYKFTQLLPLFKNRNINEFKFIDEHLSIMLLKYLFLQCIYQYITSANSQEIVSYSSEKVYNERKQSLNMLDDAVHNSSTIDVHRNEDNTELLNELEEVNINIESGYSIGLKTSELIASILLIEEKDKKKLNISYDNIVRKVSRAKDHERQVLYNDYLGSMSIEERRVANAQKKYKLGEWNVGTQKSIYQYNPNTYVADAERKVGFFEVNNTEIDVTDENPLEVDNIENTDRDTHDISHLTEDYMDGDFYPEDRDPDDFYGNT
uniref:Uncharacterized protein n=1 Tax=viral metagenome TaxID=1070528 RepID=A0A6C0AVN7_9ZZZZ|tara:strand:+ start:2926 stop:8961 length:6036 start_codon:yes stop_codon:yes gene_type:complete